MELVNYVQRRDISSYVTDELGVIYHVEDIKNQYITVRDIRTGRLTTLNAKEVTPIESFKALCSKTPTVGERLLVLRYEGQGGKMLKGRLLPKVESFFLTADGSWAVLTANNVHICQLARQIC